MRSLERAEIRAQPLLLDFFFRRRRLFRRRRRRVVSGAVPFARRRGVSRGAVERFELVPGDPLGLRLRRVRLRLHRRFLFFSQTQGHLELCFFERVELHAESSGSSAASSASAASAVGGALGCFSSGSGPLVQRSVLRRDDASDAIELLLHGRHLAFELVPDGFHALAGSGFGRGAVLAAAELDHLALAHLAHELHGGGIEEARGVEGRISLPAHLRVRRASEEDADGTALHAVFEVGARLADA